MSSPALLHDLCCFFEIPIGFDPDWGKLQFAVTFAISLSCLSTSAFKHILARGIQHPRNADKDEPAFDYFLDHSSVYFQIVISIIWLAVFADV